MSAVIAFHTFRPEVHLDYYEQAALQLLTEEEEFRGSVAFVPQRWFNGYRPKATQPSAEVQPGDLLVHLAGVPNRTVVVQEWLKYVALTRNETTSTTLGESLTEWVHQFWERLAKARRLIDEGETLLADLSETNGDTEFAKPLVLDLTELRRILSEDSENVPAIELIMTEIEKSIVKLRETHHSDERNPDAALQAASWPRH